MQRVRDLLTVGRLIRLVVLAVVAVLVLLGVRVPGAHALDRSDWVPPGQVTRSGADVSPVVVGGTVPSVTAVPPDVIERATLGEYCAVRVASLVWSGHQLTVTTAGEGGSWCFAPISLSSSWALPHLWCYVDGVAQRTTNVPSGGTVDGGATYVYTPLCGDAPAACVSWTKQEPDWSGHWDGFTSCDPNPVAATARIVYSCSDGSTGSSLLGSGLALVPPACPAGSYITALIVTGVTGSPVGSVSTHSGFPVGCAFGECLPWVLVGGQWCSVVDRSCGWWQDTSAADGCGWAPAGTSSPEMFFPLDPGDCQDARTHGGFPVPPSGTPSPTPTPTSSSTVVVNVNVNVSRVHIETDPQASGDCVAGGVQAFNPASWIIEPAKCLLIPSEGAFAALKAGVCITSDSPDKTTGGWCTLAKGKFGTYSDRINEIGGYLDDIPVADCMGPGVPLMDLVHGRPNEVVVLYPLQACVPPGRTLAAISFAGTTILCYVIGFVSLFKVVGSAVGVGLFKGNDSASGGDSGGKKE